MKWIQTTILNLALLLWAAALPEHAAAAVIIGGSTTTPTVDGICGTTPTEYGDASVVSFSSGGFPVLAYVKHTATDLYVCLSGLIVPAAPMRDGPNAVVYIDRVNAGGFSAHADTLAFSISYNGTVRATRGSGTGYSGPAIAPTQYSIARHIFQEPDVWSAEFRISQTALGGGAWNRDIRIAFAQQWVNSIGDDYGWPSGYWWTFPQTWAVGTLTGDTAPGSVNFRALRLEVTQAIQDHGHSVPLISGKRTFVRVHVDASEPRSGLTARLFGSRGTASLGAPLLPLNPGGAIVALPSPNAERIDDSLLFELPMSWTANGTTTLRAELNPAHNPGENDYSDNSSLPLDVTFVPTNPLRIVLRNIMYTRDGANVQAREFDLDMFESQLRRMYPVSQLDSLRRTLAFLGTSVFTTDHYNAAGFLNGLLAANRVVDGGVRRKQIGMVIDGGPCNTFMRGLTPWGGLGDAAWETSTPTGACDWNWDRDGSYGDWYGLHELGHALGRPHVGHLGRDIGCGAAWTIFDEAYPYDLPRIGGPGFGLQFLGFDAGDAGLGLPRRVYPGFFTDFMSYCADEWISDFNYTHIRDYINSHFGMALRGAFASPDEAGPAARLAGDFLFVYGTIDFAHQTASLPIVSREPLVSEIPPLVPGDYTLQLRNATGDILAAHAFTPLADAENPNTGLILQVVNHVPGTRRIVVTANATGNEIASLNVSLKAPQVSDVVHTGGFNLPANGPVTVTWTGTDLDGDVLHFTLKYSFDGGANWRTLAAGITSNSFTVDAEQLEGTRGALSGYFRVVANDAVNTGQAESEKFSVGGKAPVLRVANPANDSVFGYGQSFALEVSAQDFEDGALDGPAIQWNSSINGPLGTGRVLLPSLLSAGLHVITVSATDSDGQIGTASLRVTILDDVSMTAPAGIVLDVTPSTLPFVGDEGGPPPHPQTLSIRSSTDQPQTWSLVSDAPWIIFDAATGSTPADVTVSADTTGMTAGMTRRGSITVTFPGATNSPQVVPVSVHVEMTETRPKLTIRFIHDQQGDGIVVAWPASFSTYRLQVTKHPEDPSSWADWKDPVVVIGDENTVAFRPILNPPLRFFRLMRIEP